MKIVGSAPTLVLLAALGALLTLAGSPAQASETGGASARPQIVHVPQNAAGTCLSTGQVWLVVVTDTGRTLANRCVGRPANGMAALRAAGLSMTFADGGYICTLGGYPAQCPATFDNRYWHYYHSTTGNSWNYSAKGAAQYTYPSTGMIDGWCYNAAGQGCTPPQVLVQRDHQQPTTTPKPTATSRPAVAPTTARTTKPASSRPATSGAATTQAGSTKSSAQPTTSKPSTAKPNTANPATTEPATKAPTTPPATSAASTTARPTGSSTAASSRPSSSAASPTVPASSAAATPPSETPAIATPPPSDPGTPWGLVGTGIALTAGAAVFGGWRLIHRH